MFPTISFVPILEVCAIIVWTLLFGHVCPVSSAEAPSWPEKTHYRYYQVDGRNIFFREAGDPSKPTIVLLHGFPSSSHTYRELIPLLSGRYHVIAPDYLGSGFSDHPDPNQTAYSFDLLARYVSGLIESKGIMRYAIYMQDFGAPVGYRVMLQQPERLDALIVQNANAYLEGLTETRRAFFRNAHQDRSPENISLLYALVERGTIINKQYLRDVKGKETAMSPDSWTHDLAFLQSENDKTIQVRLFQDYYNNILSYSAWQAFLRSRQPPTLILWGKNDPAFIVDGAMAYLKDLPKAELHLLDAGHFALEEKPVEIAQYILTFLEKVWRK